MKTKLYIPSKFELKRIKKEIALEENNKHSKEVENNFKESLEKLKRLGMKVQERQTAKSTVLKALEKHYLSYSSIRVKLGRSFERPWVKLNKENE